MLRVDLPFPIGKEREREKKMPRYGQEEGTRQRIDVKVVGRRRNLPGPGNKTGKRSRSHVRPRTTDTLHGRERPSTRNRRLSPR